MQFESSLAESVFKSKYLLEGETTADEAVNRVVKTVSKIYPEIESEALEYINKQWFLPAGGVWRASGNPNKNVSFINCTNLGHIEDNLEGIFDNAYKWAKYAAYGQGEGQDLSLLRPKGAKVHNSSHTSSGAVSFAYIYDMVLKVITQNGRRGASLFSMIDHHPDIFDFISMKDKPESDNSRIDTANISVKATDEFMKAVINDDDWSLWFENKYERIEKKVKARDVFDAICLMAWKRGDPGLQFIDTWRKYSNSDPLGYPLEASNACFAGSTMIAVADGRNAVTIEQLANESNGLIKFPVYSARKRLARTDLGSHKVEVKNAVAFLSGERKMIEIKLSDGSSFKCTPDHKICTFDGRWIEAKDLKNEQLSKFFSYVNNNQFNRSHRMINTLSNRHTSQYRLIWEFYTNKKHNGLTHVLHHKDNNPKNDLFTNLELTSKEKHDALHSKERCGLGNPIYKMNSEYRVWQNRRKNILANATRYRWTDARKQEALDKFLNENPKPEVPFVDKNVYYNYPIYVTDIIDTGKVEKVYDLTVEDNHSFYIITKTEDENYYNCSGVLVHNCGEIPADKDNVCMLGHINLAKYREYGHEGFIKLIKFQVKFLNACRLTEYNEERSPVPEQRKKLIDIPRIGGGDTGFADYLLDKKIKYGSEESIKEREYIGRTMARYAYKTGYELAKKYGSYPAYDKEKIKQSAYIQHLLNEGVIDDSDLDHQYNVQYLTIAPTGCLIEDTLIQTKDSIKSIKQIFSENGYNLEDIKNKENCWFVPSKSLYVKTMNGLKQIIKLYVNGFKKTLILYNNSNKLIEGTENHMVLIKKSKGVAIWKRLDEIKEGDIIITKK